MDFGISVASALELMSLKAYSTQVFWSYGRRSSGREIDNFDVILLFYFIASWLNNLHFKVTITLHSVIVGVESLKIKMICT